LISPGIQGPLAATLIALLGAAAGIRLVRRPGRLLVPLSGAILVAVTVFGLVPELVRELGYVVPFALMASAYLALSVLDRQGFPVCPSCSHGEEYAATLLAAAGIHAFVDGWGMAAADTGRTVPLAIGAAIVFHKIPEGLALGGLLRGASIPPARAMLLAAAAESPTLLGGLAGLHSAPGRWTNYAFALAAGTFFFFGIHAIEGWRIRANLQTADRRP